jgi:hypothetical protein
VIGEGIGWIPVHPGENPRAWMIPVADPENTAPGVFQSVEVLITDGKKIHIGCYCYKLESGITCGDWNLRDAYQVYGIIKWMPLPDL